MLQVGPCVPSLFPPPGRSPPHRRRPSRRRPLASAPPAALPHALPEIGVRPRVLTAAAVMGGLSVPPPAVGIGGPRVPPPSSLLPAAGDCVLRETPPAACRAVAAPAALAVTPGVGGLRTPPTVYVSPALFVADVPLESVAPPSSAPLLPTITPPTNSETSLAPAFAAALPVRVQRGERRAGGIRRVAPTVHPPPGRPVYGPPQRPYVVYDAAFERAAAARAAAAAAAESAAAAAAATAAAAAAGGGGGGGGGGVLCNGFRAAYQAARESLQPPRSFSGGLRRVHLLRVHRLCRTASP